jgi:hypothetical protein
MSSLAVILTGLLFRHEVRVRRAEQEDAAGAQARLIVSGLPGRPDEGEPLPKISWRVNNYSSAPIFNLQVAVVPHTYRSPRVAARAVVPGPNEGSIYSTVRASSRNSRTEPDWTERPAARLMASGDESTGEYLLTSPIIWPRASGLELTDRFCVLLRFTDGAGVQWERQDELAPKRVHSS